MIVLLAFIAFLILDIFAYYFLKEVDISDRKIRIIKACCEITSTLVMLYLVFNSIKSFFTFPIDPLAWAEKYYPYFATCIICWIMDELPKDKFFRVFHSFDEIFLIMIGCVYLLAI